MIKKTDTTPLTTRIILIFVLLITAVTIIMLRIGLENSVKPNFIVTELWLFTVLFVIRVVGQIVVAIRPQSWLPPMYQWNLIPYPILLPIQLLFIIIMLWINIAFSRETGIAVAINPGFGHFLIIFSAIYALSMPIRYVVRMSRQPDQRWFGGTIPMVFHIVLASYLFTLGSFYAAT